jgi:ABC-type branched-subunit amino acid transport system substrate-binding protein
MHRSRSKLILVAAAALLFPAALCARDYGPGVSESQIKIGQTMPYSGPASAYGVQGFIQQAYFAMVNAKGGVNGRKIVLISLDDAYNPTKTVEQTRRLVEQDEIFAIIGTVGTPTNSAIQRYLNDRKVPHLLIASGDGIR